MLIAEDADDFLHTALAGRHPFFWYSRVSYNNAMVKRVGSAAAADFVSPVHYGGETIDYDLLDMIWGFYYPWNLADADQAATLTAIPVRWRRLSRAHRPPAVVVLSDDAGDGARAIALLHRQFGATLSIAAYRLLSRGPFTVHVWVLDVDDPSR
jgi:hypothetical protein